MRSCGIPGPPPVACRDRRKNTLMLALRVTRHALPMSFLSPRVPASVGEVVTKEHDETAQVRIVRCPRHGGMEGVICVDSVASVAYRRVHPRHRSPNRFQVVLCPSLCRQFRRSDLDGLPQLQELADLVPRRRVDDYPKIPKAGACSDEHAGSLSCLHEAVGFETRHRLAHNGSADSQHSAKLLFRRHLAARPKLAASDAGFEVARYDFA